MNLMKNYRKKINFFSAAMSTTYHFAWLVTTKRTEIEKVIACDGRPFGFLMFSVKLASYWKWLVTVNERDDIYRIPSAHRQLVKRHKLLLIQLASNAFSEYLFLFLFTKWSIASSTVRLVIAHNEFYYIFASHSTCANGFWQMNVHILVPIQAPNQTIS